MRRKLNILAICSFALSLSIHTFSYMLYHYLSPDGGFTRVYQNVPAKPLVTELFSIWGTMFLFAAVMSWLIGLIFFKGSSK